MIRNVFMIDRQRLESMVIAVEDFDKVKNLIGIKTIQFLDFIGITEDDNSVSILKNRFTPECFWMSEDEFEDFVERYLT